MRMFYVHCQIGVYSKSILLYNKRVENCQFGKMDWGTPYKENGHWPYVILKMNFEYSQKNPQIMQRLKSTSDIVCVTPLIITKWKRV